MWRGVLLLVHVVLLTSAPARAAETKLPAPLVFLRDVEPGIEQDMRYAGSRNFTGRPVPGYEAAECILTRGAAQALSSVQMDLAAKGFALRVYDCYRPERAVRAFMRWVKSGASTPQTATYRPNIAQRSLVAAGYLPSRSTHSTGRAIDLTIVPRASTAAELPVQTAVNQPEAAGLAPCTAPEADRGSDGSVDMGTSYDCFDPKSHTQAADLTEAQRDARSLLVRAMQAHGFENYAKEWWHFSFASGPSRSFDVPVRRRDEPR